MADVLCGVQGHVLCRVPLETAGSEILANLEYVVEAETAESVGEGLCVYLVDPSVDGWDQHFDGDGPTGLVGKKGVVLGVVIDLTGNLCGEANHAAIVSASGDVVHKCALSCEPITPEDEWRQVGLKFNIKTNTCDMTIEDEVVMTKIPLGDIQIPGKVCIGVCAGSNEKQHALICVNDLYIVDEDSMEEACESAGAVVALMEAAGCAEEAAAVEEVKAQLSGEQKVSGAEMKQMAEGMHEVATNLETAGKSDEAAEARKLAEELAAAAEKKVVNEEKIQKLTGGAVASRVKHQDYHVVDDEMVQADTDAEWRCAGNPCATVCVALVQQDDVLILILIVVQVDYGFELTQDEAKDQQVWKQQTTGGMVGAVRSTWGMAELQPQWTVVLIWLTASG